MLLYMTYIASHTIINCIIAGVLVTEAAYFGQLVHPCNRQLTHTCIFFFNFGPASIFFLWTRNYEFPSKGQCDSSLILASVSHI